MIKSLPCDLAHYRSDPAMLEAIEHSDFVELMLKRCASQYKEIERLKKVITEREAEIMRVRTTENANAVAMDSLRIALTELPYGTHPRLIAEAITGAHDHEV